MDWTSFLAGVLIAGVVFGFMAFILGIAVGGLVAQREDRLSKLVDQLKAGEHIYLSKDQNDCDGEDDDDPPAMDFLMDESKRMN